MKVQKTTYSTMKKIQFYSLHQNLTDSWISGRWYDPDEYDASPVRRVHPTLLQAKYRLLQTSPNKFVNQKADCVGHKTPHHCRPQATCLEHLKSLPPTFGLQLPRRTVDALALQQQSTATGTAWGFASPTPEFNTGSCRWCTSKPLILLLFTVYFVVVCSLVFQCQGPGLWNCTAMTSEIGRSQHFPPVRDFGLQWPQAGPQALVWSASNLNKDLEAIY
jgi:hypothetical protein